MIKVLVLGCNYDQIPYIKKLQKKYYIVGADLNQEAPGKNLCDKFYNVGYNDFKNLIEIGNKEEFNKNDKVFTAAAQFAHLGCSHFASKFGIKYPPTKSIEICLDKTKFYKFFRENELPIPHTIFVENEESLKESIIQFGINKKYYLKSDYSKNPNYVYNFNGFDHESIDIFWGRDRFLRNHYILQQEFIGEHIRINLIGKEFIIFPMNYGDKLIITKKKVEKMGIIDKLTKIIKKLKIDNWIVKFDIVINESDFVALDIGLDPPYRLNLLYNELKLDMSKFYIEQYLNNQINYPVLSYDK